MNPAATGTLVRPRERKRPARGEFPGRRRARGTFTAMSRLRIHDAAGEREFALDRDVVTIGLSPDCDVDLADAGASPEHCELQRDGDGWRLVDLESRDGTRVNGDYVNHASLSDGDVIQIGATRIEFVAGAGAPPVMVPVAEPIATPPATPTPGKARSSSRAALSARVERPSRRGGPRRGGRDDYEDDREERRPRRPRRSSSNNAVTLVMIIAGVIAFVGLGAMLVPKGGTTNSRIWQEVKAAELRGDPQAVIDAARGAEPLDDSFYPRIQASVEDAKKALAGGAGEDRTRAAIDAWNDIVQWEYRHRDDKDGMVARIDAFLAEFGPLKGAAVDAARKKRVELTGSPDPGRPASASAAWESTQTVISAYRKKGRFGEAITAVQRFRRDHGADGSVSPSTIDETIVELEEQAKRWFALQVSLAEQKIELNNFFEARKIMERAARRMQMPAYEERAMEELNRLRALQRSGE